MKKSVKNCLKIDQANKSMIILNKQCSPPVKHFWLMLTIALNVAINKVEREGKAVEWETFQ